MSVLDMSIAELSAAWIEAKEQERLAVERRRVLEDHLALCLDLAPDLDTTVTKKTSDYTIKCVGRLNRKVDAERLQEIATEHGLENHLSSLFRWKPEIDMRAWKSCDQSITNLLAEAITVSPGRPSFAITKNED